MASSSTLGPTFSFLHLPHHPTTKIPKLPLPFLFKPPKLSSFAISSLDVTKDDKPLNNTSSSSSAPAEEVELEEFPEAELPLTSGRPVEKFAVLNTGVSECGSCGHLYEETKGDPSYPVPPGMQFDKLPEDWRCPTCGASKSFFRSKSVEVAGFAENMQFGLGANTLTSGQKALLIYGSLLAFFVLFLSGYFLQ